MCQQHVNKCMFISLRCVGGGAERDKQPLLPISHMATFKIPIDPPITKRKSTCLMFKAHVRHRNCAIIKLPYGSIAYDCKKGTMSLEWENEDAFLVWLAAEEHKNVIQLVVSHTEHSNSVMTYEFISFHFFI